MKHALCCTPAITQRISTVLRLRHWRSLNRCSPLVRVIIAGLTAVLIQAAVVAQTGEREPSQRPNIVMIAIDDLNDWIEPLQGHPQVKTPHMARLAERGVTFTNAHCQAPLCNPSRTSLMTGRRPTSTGIYGLQPWIRNVDELKDLVTMPQYFGQHGYKTLLGGKIHHGANGRRKGKELEADVWGPPASVGAKPKQKLIPPTPGGNHPLMDWGTFPHRDQDKGDWIVASWAVNQLQQLGKQTDSEEPFFLAAGFFLPHPEMVRHVSRRVVGDAPDPSLGPR